jgi:hypothetical protein
VSALPTSARMLRAEVSSEVQRPGNSLSIGTQTADTETPLATMDIGEAIDLALKRAGISHKQACAYMNDLDRSQWSKQLKGQDNHQASIQRLALLPAAFWVEFIAILSGPLQIVVSRADYVDLMMLKVVGLVQEIGVVALQARAQRRIA